MRESQENITGTTSLSSTTVSTNKKLKLIVFVNISFYTVTLTLTLIVFHHFSFDAKSTFIRNQSISFYTKSRVSRGNHVRIEFK